MKGKDTAATTQASINTIDDLNALIERVSKAQKILATYSQEQVDKIFEAMAIAANANRIPLAKMAVEETGMGVVEDKVIKNHFAAEEIYNKLLSLWGLLPVLFRLQTQPQPQFLKA